MVLEIPQCVPLLSHGQSNERSAMDPAKSAVQVVVNELNDAGFYATPSDSASSDQESASASIIHLSMDDETSQTDSADSTATGESGHFWAEVLGDGEESALPLRTAPASATPMNFQTTATCAITQPDGNKFPDIEILQKLACAAWAILLGRYNACTSDVLYAFSADLHLHKGHWTHSILPMRISVPAATESIHSYVNRVVDTCDNVVHHSLAFDSVLMQFPRQQRHRSLLAFAHSSAALPVGDCEADLTLTFEPSTEGGFHVCARYSTEALSDTQASRIVEQLAFVTAQLILHRASGVIVADMDFCSPQDIAQITTWSSPTPSTNNTCLHDMVRSACSRFSDLVAVEAWDRTLTYYDVDQLSDKLAYNLYSSGIRAGCLVPLMMNRSALVPVVQLAVLKTGSAYVGVDPSYPTERLKKLFDAAGARFVITSPELRLKATITEAKIVEVSFAMVQDLPALIPEELPVVNPQDTCVVIFTSGSTGTPKGIEMRHSDFASAIEAHSAGMKIPQRSRVLHFSNYTFDHSMYEILTTLVGGCIICIPTEEQRLNDFPGVVRALKINFLYATPSVAKLLDPRELPELKTLYLGGEAIPQSLLETWLASKDVIAGYGPTEAGMCGYGQFSSGDHSATIHKSQGGPMWIVDPHNFHQLAPVGTVGELLAEGPMIAKGYLNDPTKTAAGFVTSPTWRHRFPAALDPSSQRFYRTGDYAQYNENGTYRFLGRIDTQVKLRGLRIDLEDIEDAMRPALPAGVVSCAAVVKLAGDREEGVLVAFLSSMNSSLPSGKTIALAQSQAQIAHADSIRTHLGNILPSVLPAHMIPSIYIPLATPFPMTASGKLDRKQLIAFASHYGVLDFLPEHRSDESFRALTAREAALQHAWASILGLLPRDIHAESHFYRSGGDSVAAMRLVGSLRKSGLSLTIADVIRHPVLCQMARVAVEKEEVLSESIAPFSLLGSDTDSVINLAAKSCNVAAAIIEDVMPCTALQAGLLVASSREEGMYVLQKVSYLPQAIDLERFMSAWNVVARHSASCLRTRFILGGDQDLQQVIIKEDIEWQTSRSSLEEYLRTDKAVRMGLNDRMARFAILQSESLGATFVLTIHHAIHDAFSLDLLLAEVASVYSGNNPKAYTNPAAFIKHVSNADRSLLESRWLRQLDQAPVTLFPRVPPKHAVKCNRFQVHQFQLPGEHQTSLGYSKALKIQAAWGLWLASRTGSNDVLFHNVSNGRGADVPDVENLMTATIATVPYRVQFTDARVTLGSLMEACQTRSADLIKIEQYGLHNICQALGNNAEIVSSIQTLLLVELENERPQADLQFTEDGTQGGSAFHNFALGIRCSISKRSLTLTANWDDALIGDHKMSRILQQFEHIIRLVFSVSTSTMLRDLLSAGQTDLEAIGQWNIHAPAASATCIQDSFHMMSLQQPERLAIHASDGQLTYSELDSISDRLAFHLLDRTGTKQIGGLVALAFDKQILAFISILAVYKAGGAVVMLDMSLPPQRREQILQSAAPKLLLFSPQHSSSFTDYQGDAWEIDNSTLQLPTLHMHIDLPVVSLDSPAYATFTSGSTGTAKGVLISHRAVATSIGALIDRLSLSSATRLLQIAPYAFDAFYGEFLCGLISGCSLYAISDHERDHSLSSYIQDHHVDWAFLTPSVAVHLDAGALSTLQNVGIGGEAMTEACLRLLEENVKVFNIYGPAETTISCAVNADASLKKGVGNVGCAVGSRLWITDKNDLDVLAPIGSVGELLVEGPTLSLGYLGDPVKTAAAFRYDPKWSIEGHLSEHFWKAPRRFYRTGDLAVYNEDGTIEVLGRRDSQIKIRGMRVEIGDVEAQMANLLQGVDFSVEGVRLKSTGAVTLVAFIVCRVREISAALASSVISKDDKDIESITSIKKAVLEKLNDLLPAHMIPTVFIPVSRIPKTASSKSDRKLLRDLIEAMSDEELLGFNKATGSYRSPETVAEKRLRGFWATALGRPEEQISVDDSLFRIGGDSIVAMKLIALARNGSYSLTTQQIFQNPVLSDMALGMQVVERGEDSTIRPFHLLQSVEHSVEAALQQASAACGVSRASIEDIYPCTPLQSSLMALSAKSPGTYTGQLTVILPNHIDRDRWRGAWESVCRSTPVLRTRFFHSVSTQLMQAVVQFTPDWQSGSSRADYLDRDRSTPMDLGKPLCRYALIQDGSRTCFALSLHRSIYDAWSLSILFKNLEQCYIDNNTAAKPAAGFNIFSNLFLQMNWQLCESFWKEQLADAPGTSFPRLPHVSYQPSATANYQSSTNVVASVLDYTGATVVRATLAVLLARYSDDSSDIVFGASLNGRSANVKGISTIIGPTTAVVPVRVRWNKAQQSVRDLLAQVQRQAAETTAFEQYGVYNMSKLSPQMKQACAFQTLLMIQSDVESHGASSGSPLGLEVVDEESGSFHTFAMSLDVTTGLHRTSLKIEFDPKIISSIEAERFAAQFEQLLGQMSNPSSLDLKVDELDLVSPADHRQLLIWNGSPPPLKQTSVHSLFQGQSKMSPKAPALCSWQGEMTYQELDHVSDGLAHQLMRRGVQRGVLVPLLFEKSIETVVTMMAVLKAGGACAALDPAHPLERLDALVQNLGSPLIVASRQWAEKSGMLKKDLFVVDGAALMEARERSLETIYSEENHARPSDPAFILHTSGSTGVPKAIVITHASFASSIRGHADILNYGSIGSRNFQFTAYTSDVSFGEIFTSLAVGACVCIPSDEERMNGIAASMERMGVTWAFLTPSVASLLNPKDVPTLKTLVFGGETASVANISNWAPAVHLINSFGPAECSIWTHCVPGIRPDASGHNIGDAIGCNTWIVDPDNHNRLAPIHTVGELIVEGPNVADGYLNNPEKTEAAFINPPEWLPKDRPQGKLYKMGDLVRYLPDGKVHYIGRRDTQVKLRGQRIELGEIEHQLRRAIPTVREIAVEMVRVAQGNAAPTLVAFLGVLPNQQGGRAAGTSMPEIVTDYGHLREYSIAMDHLADTLKGTLPRHMIPSAFVPLALMPLTASSKIDRGKLRTLAQAMSLQQLSRYSATTTVFVTPPTTQAEVTLHALWTKLLNVPGESFGRDSDFFSLGGDSITAMRLVGLARAEYLNLSVKSIFADPVLSAMALAAKPLQPFSDEAIAPYELVDGVADIRKYAATACGVSVDDIEDVYPPTGLQEGLIALAQKEQGSYVAQFAFEIPDHIDIARLRISWETAYQQVPILRTRLFLGPKGIMQAVVKSKLLWRGSASKQAYLQDDLKLEMTVGQPLTRFAIVEKNILVFSCHHAVYDGWSVQPIYRRVEEIYHGLNTKQPVPYNRFIKYITAIDQDAQKKFWRAQLLSATASVFPFSKMDQRYNEASLSISFDFARRPGSSFTAATLMRTALAVVLGKYSETFDVVFGSTQSGRAALLQGIEDVAGPTITTTPVRVAYTAATLVTDLLQQVQDQSTEIIPYEQMGLQHIAALSDDAKIACDFKVLMSFQNPDDEFTKSHTTFLGCNTSDQSFFKTFKTYPLILQCTFGDTGYILDASFDQSALSTAQARRFLQHFHRAAELLDANELGLTIGEFDLSVSDDQRDIGTFNASLPLPIENCLHTLFSRVAQRQPGAAAVATTSGTNLSYGDLDHLSSGFAARLVSKGVKSSDVVLFCQEKSVHGIVGLLGILKAGAAYCPIDSRHPRERRLQIAEEVGARFVVTTPSTTPSFDNFPCSVVEFPTNDPQSLMAEAKTFDASHPRATPDDTAYICFTSGSSGRPKGVVTSHRAIATSVTAHGGLGLTARSRMLQFAEYTFDISIVEQFSTLAHGGCVCVLNEAQRLDGMVEAMHSLGVTIAILTPSFAKAVDPNNLPHLEQLVLGAEPIRRELISAWVGRVRLMNAYGVTEAAICNLIADIEDDQAPEQRIGKSVGSVNWIVSPNDCNCLVPVGMVGELAIEGPVLANGYFRQTEKTAAVFRDNPAFLDTFATENADNRSRRIYLTGDLVKYEPDGNIVYVGRKDTQVKLRGLRIELGEIEYQVRRALATEGLVEAFAEVITPGGRTDHPAIAIFLSFGGAIDDSRESSYLRSPTSELHQRISTLHDALFRVLPSYMIPSFVYFLDRVPRVQYGKVDRKKLKLLAFEHESTVTLEKSREDGKEESASSEMEFKLQAMWAVVLSIPAESIFRGSSFFRLGGDSLAAVKLVSVARCQQIGLTVAKIFEQPTLSQMALLVTTTNPSIDAPPPYSLIKPDDLKLLLTEAVRQTELSAHDIQDMYPATALQEGMMVASLQDVGTYNAHFAYRLTSTVDVPRFRQAWEEVAASCAIMRTRIVHTDALGFTQVVHSSNLHIQGISGVDVAAYKASVPVMGLGQALYHLAFLGEDQTDPAADRWFVLTAHHAAYDGVSLTNIWRNVQEAYFDLARSPMLGMNHLMQYLASQTVTENLDFWEAYLEGSKPPAFPPYPHTGYRSVADSELTVKLKFTKPSTSDNTVATLLQAAWGLLMALYEGTDDVTFGVVVSGRTTPVPGMENIVGSSISNFPFRAKFNGQNTVTESLDKTRLETTRMIPYQQFGFQNIRKASADARASSALRTLLVFQSGGVSALNLNIERLGIQPQPVTVAGLYTFPITATCSLEGEHISANVSYDSQLISDTEITRLMHQFEHIIEQMTMNPDCKLADLDLTGQHDIAQIASWQDRDRIVPNETTIHAMFRKQAARTPLTPAISSWDGELTYAELDDFSDRLAQALIDQGIRAGIFVGFCFDKSQWTVVAILAILKAGGVWAPLNPSHPQTRLSSLIHRLEAPIVLTAPQHQHLFHELGTTVLPITGDSIRALEPARLELRNVEVGPSDAAYVMFTSGSTGEPKGVIVEHRNAASGLPAQAQVQGKKLGSRYLQFAAFTWDFCVGEIFANLLSGGCVCMPSEHDRVNNLASAIKTLRIEQASLTPTVAKLLDPEQTPLKTLSLGGEALTQDLVNLWAPHTNLINVYGPTECTVWCAGRDGLRVGDSPANVGWGLNCSMWIADPENYGRLMPIGVPGEVLVDGPVVARGYHNDPVRTAQVFVERPSWATAYKDRGTDRLYATGDLGVYERDGSIRILGRRDMQVKLNGQRVDLGEIDYQILQALPPGWQVATEVVMVRQQDRPLLVAFMVDPATEQDESAVRLLQLLEHQKEKLDAVIRDLQHQLGVILPTFMIPRLYLPVSKIPASANLKVDHNMLKSLCATLSVEEISRLACIPAGQGRETKAPTTEASERLQHMWAKILSIPATEIFASSDFASLGGDSMSAVRLVSLARTEGFNITVADILQHQELDDMASHMRELSSNHDNDHVPYSLVPASGLESLKKRAVEQSLVDEFNVSDIYPASAAQVGFTEAAQLNPGVTSLLTVFEIPAAIQPSRLKTAWMRLVKAHAILRTRIFQDDGGAWHQVVEGESAPVAWREADSVREYFAQESRDPIHLGTYLTRGGLVSDLSTGKQYFCTTACHSTYDAWAYALLFAALERAYVEDAPPTAEVPYKRFVRYLQNMDKSVSDTFWRNQFVDYIPPPLLGTVPENHKIEANTIADLEVHFSKSRLRPDVSMPTAIYAAWGLALCQLTGASDVALLLTLSGRNAPVAEIERIIGPILTTVPLRIKVDRTSSVRRFLRSLESNCRAMIAHEQCDLQRIRTLSPETQAAVDRSFGLTVNPYNHHKADVGGAIGLVRPLRIPVRQSPAPFFLDCAITDYGTDAFALFDDRVVDRATVKRFMAHFESNLRNLVVGNGDVLIKDLALNEDLLGEEGQNMHMTTVASGLGYDPVTKCSVNIDTAFAAGGLLERGFKEYDALQDNRGAIASEHSQFS